MDVLVPENTEKKRVYYTTTLPYVNADPHIGFALEIVHADSIARARRLMGHDVFFNTGTDEHGLKIYRRALEEGKEPQHYVDEYAAKFDRLKEKLHLSYDNFIRTSDAHHVAAAQEFWKRCKDNGDVYKKLYAIQYCVGCELEKSDSELVDGKCPIHPNLALEHIEEENYFFRFSKYQKPLLELYAKRPDFVVPDFRLNEIRIFVERGLEDFSISRLKNKMPWGVPVPDDPDHGMYVWFDALVSYISAIGWPREMATFDTWWPVVQFAGKDNLRQQSAMWQAMLMSASIAPSQQIVIHGFITSGGQKMSKSLGNVIDPFAVVDEYGTDALRYYLLRHVHPFEDSDFTMEKFKEAYNGNLANGLGNFVARVMALAQKLKLKNQKSKLQFKNNELEDALNKAKETCAASIVSYRVNEAMDAIWSLIAAGDKYVAQERPWEGGREEAIENAAALLGEVAGLLLPFMPETAEAIKLAVEQKSMPAPLFPRKWEQRSSR